ncbi:hypothetical protein QA089_003661 [Meyerozyma guilliermondii]
MPPAHEKKPTSRMTSRHAALRNKPKKSDPLASSASFQLLCKLFVPTKYFKKTDKLTSKQLSTYLPTIVSRHSDLNFQLHLLLASIVNKFVASWYLGKLKTDNLEFLQLVYKCLSDLCSDLTSRCYSSCGSDRLYGFMDEIMLILDEHVQQMYQLRTDIRRQQSLNVEERLEEDIVSEFLRQKHQIFTDQDEYLQALTSRVLELSLSECDIHPTSSQLTSTFCTVLVSDTILKNLLDKFSQPEFLSQILAKILLREENAAKTKESDSNTSQLSKWYSVYTSKDTKYDIVGSPLWSLANTITGISDRKPLLAAAFQILRKLASIPAISQLADSCCEFLVRSKLQESGVFSEPSICSWVQNLRRIIDDEDQKPSESVTPEFSKYDIASAVTSSEPARKIPIARILAYSNESDEEIYENVVAFIELFKYRETNKLLLIRILDALIGHIYPEL